MEDRHFELLRLLELGGYEYSFHEDTLIFKDKRIRDIIASYNNYHLYQAIRADGYIRVLDISQVPNIPEEINDFLYVEEIIMPVLTNRIPKIKNCPNLFHIEFDASTITYLDSHSFQGWPPLNYLKFGLSLKRVAPFGGSTCNVTIIDLSDCSFLTLDEHAFQGNKYLKKCILPDSIKNLANYTFLGCANLSLLSASGVTEIYLSTFGGNFKLKSIKLSSEIEENKIIKRIGGDDFHKNYDRRHSGIVLEVDSEFVYIFSFKDFKFYFTENTNCFNKYDFITFNQDISDAYGITKGYISLSSNYDDYHAIEVENLNSWDSSPFSNKYLIRKSGPGLVVNTENLQYLSYLSLNGELREKYNVDLRDVVENIMCSIESLNIAEIINSFHTVIDEWVHTKIGGDDTFYSSIDRSANYSDPYIETLLPSFHYHDKQSAYTSRWDYTDKKRWKEKDEEYRNNARAKYNKDEHISFLLKHYVHMLVLDSIKSEKYLHISRAIEILETKKTLIGKNKVLEVNRIFTL